MSIRFEQKVVVFIYIHSLYYAICTHPFLSKNSLSGLETTSISGLSLIESCEEDGTFLCCKEDTLLCSRSDVFVIEIDAAGVLTLVNAFVEIANIANRSNRIDLDATMAIFI